MLPYFQYHFWFSCVPSEIQALDVLLKQYSCLFSFHLLAQKKQTKKKLVLTAANACHRLDSLVCKLFSVSCTNFSLCLGWTFLIHQICIRMFCMSLSPISGCVRCEMVLILKRCMWHKPTPSWWMCHSLLMETNVSATALQTYSVKSGDQVVTSKCQSGSDCMVT